MSTLALQSTEAVATDHIAAVGLQLLRYDTARYLYDSWLRSRDDAQVSWTVVYIKLTNFAKGKIRELFRQLLNFANFALHV